MGTDSPERIEVKICGLTRLEDARFAAGALADYLGFIFYEESPRYITPAKAGAIVNWLEGSATVGVFVNQPLDDVNMIAKQTGIGMVQLHGKESPEYCQMVDLPVIKAFHVHDEMTRQELLDLVEPYLDHVDRLLFDTGGRKVWGGTGETFNWEIVRDLSLPKPFFLSGGLNPENIRQACRVVQPSAVDLNSGVEMSPGLKDFDKLEALFEQMEAVQSDLHDE